MVVTNSDGLYGRREVWTFESAYFMNGFSHPIHVCETTRQRYLEPVGPAEAGGGEGDREDASSPLHVTASVGVAGV